MSVLAQTAGPGPAAPATSPSRRRDKVVLLLLLPALLWLVVFFVVPTVQLAATSLYDPTGSLEAGYSLTWHWQTYLDVLRVYEPHFIRSLAYAGIATLLALLLGYALAYAIAFKAGRWKNVMLVLVIAPFFTSFLIRTLAWQAILADNGFVVDSFKTLGMLGADDRLLATPIAVVTGLTYNFLPFMTLPLYASLEKIDGRLIEAAGDLYSNPVTAFRRVTLPLSMPGLVSGTLLTFIPASGDYINAELLGTPNEYMIGNVIQSKFLVVNDYPQAAALSFLLMAAILVLVIGYIRRAGTEELL